jgi:hypothetical protein
MAQRREQAPGRRHPPVARELGNRCVHIGAYAVETALPRELIRVE